MPHFIRCALAVITTTGSLALLAFLVSTLTSAPAPAAPRQVITSSRPNQISGTLGATSCAWLMTCFADLTRGIGGIHGPESMLTPLMPDLPIGTESVGRGA